MINFSENIESLEEIIIAYLLGVDEDSKITDENGIEVEPGKLICVLKSEFFTVPFYSESFKLIKKFYSSYNKTPNINELKKILELNNTQIDEAKLVCLSNMKVSSYANDFLYKYIKSFLMVRVLNSQINKVAIKLKTEKPDPDNINKVVDYVRTELSENIDVEITNSNMGLDVFNPEDHIQKDKNNTSTGFEYLDIVLGGGYEQGTLIVFQGRAKIGKSLILSNLATRACKLGSNVGIYSVELGADKYIKRVGANIFNIESSKYKGFNDKNNLSLLKDSIKKFRTENPNAGHLDIKESPTGSVTVLDIENYYLKYEKKNNCKMDVIYVDYLNLLKPIEVALAGNMYLSIKKICEDLRRIAQRNKWCIVSATQIKSSAFTSDDLGLDSTAESSGLIATVDALFGLTGQPDTPYIKIKNIANRDGGYMNSYANYIKDMIYFRLNEEDGEYMNLGMEASMNYSEYQQYKSSPVQTYSPEVSYVASPEIPNHPQVQTYSPEVAFENAPVEQFKPQINMLNPASINNIDNLKMDAPIDELPMGETYYNDAVFHPNIQVTQVVNPQMNTQTPVNTFCPKPIENFGQYQLTVQAQPQTFVPPAAQHQTQPVYQTQPQYAQPEAQKFTHPVAQPTQQYVQPQQVQQQKNPATNRNKESTLLVNTLTEEQKHNFITRSEGVMSIVNNL